MALLLQLVFWAAAALLMYVYIGYPLLLRVAAGLRTRPPRSADILPTVSIVIAAFNESRAIGATIENKVALDYPRDRVQIVVVSDGSTDGTDDIIRTFGDRGVQYLRQDPRSGKTAALNRALAHATGEIVVFSDANSIYDAAAVRRLVRVFADPAVGYATGSLAYQTASGSLSSEGCGAYMTYENRIRESETAIGSVVGVNGGLDAVRRSLYAPMAAHDLPDLVLPLRVVEAGFRVVYVADALFAEPALERGRDEYRMRVRVALRSLWTLYDQWRLLLPWRSGIFALQLWSHKLLRYLAPVLILATFAASGALAVCSPWYGAIALLHLMVAGLALLGFRAEGRRDLPGWLFVPYYFTLVNLAALHALWRFARGERHALWAPRLG